MKVQKSYKVHSENITCKLWNSQRGTCKHAAYTYDLMAKFLLAFHLLISSPQLHNIPYIYRLLLLP